MKTAEFDYHLPPELIAQTPLESRDASRLLVVDRATGRLTHARFSDLPQFLRPGDLLVHNRTRVIPARLFARKPTGGRVEILLLRPRTGQVWEALVRGRGTRAGLRLDLLDGPDGEPVGAEARILEQGQRGLRVVGFDRPALPLAEQAGVVPLPPYIHEPLKDPERYQTVYAQEPGSAAAPTAGLHFTPELLLALRDLDIRSTFVTLHVGLDTFLPVTEAQVEDHAMHKESCTLSPEVAAEVNQARLEGRRLVAVGTTSVRVLETAARIGTGGPADADGCPMRTVGAFDGRTGLFIYPGFRFRVVDALITNFHLPRSTLLMLVAAFCGKDLSDQAYREAISQRYRFYSFGDAMLIV